LEKKGPELKKGMEYKQEEKKRGAKHRPGMKISGKKENIRKMKT